MHLKDKTAKGERVFSSSWVLLSLSFAMAKKNIMAARACPQENKWGKKKVWIEKALTEVH